jgi:hypothetical protein
MGEAGTVRTSSALEATATAIGTPKPPGGAAETAATSSAIGVATVMSPLPLRSNPTISWPAAVRIADPESPRAENRTLIDGSGSGFGAMTTRPDTSCPSIGRMALTAITTPPVSPVRNPRLTTSTLRAVASAAVIGARTPATAPISGTLGFHTVSGRSSMIAKSSVRSLA